MYCPKCAAQNIDDAQFCRTCGANIGLVPQALTGKLPAAKNSFLPMPPLAPLAQMQDFGLNSRRKKDDVPRADQGVKHIFMGIGFILVALSIALFGHDVSGKVWWYWMLIPAFSLLGGGVAELMRAKQQKQLAPPPQQPAAPLASDTRAKEFAPRNTTGFAAPPPSVTEGTTRHLGSEAATQHFDATVERPIERKSNDML
ncbi:MAG: zinc-ribbon domain-containing protein [Pyrinomonadaceae bacterium]